MGEEGDKVKLDRLERDVSSLETDSKDMSSRMIRIEINVDKILATYTLIQNTAIGILVVNIAGILWAVNNK